MPRVPYNPVPSAQPEVRGEAISVSTPGAAFGENIGAALQHIGATEQQAGGELFQRALAMQELRNDNDARDALTDYMGKQGEAHAQFSALTGKAAADGLQPYIQSSRSLLNDTANGLRSPAARKMFLDSATSFLGRNIFNAAGHAATENKQYTINTYKAQTDLDVKATGDNPDDEGFIQRQRAKIAHDVTQQTMLIAGVGEDSPIVKDAVTNALSHQRYEQIKGKATANPVAAQGMFDKAIAAGELVGPDKDKLSLELEGRSAAVAGSNVARAVVNKYRQSDGTYSATVQQMQDEVRTTASKGLPNNPIVGDVAVSRLDGMINNDRYSARVDKAEGTQALYDLIGKNNIQDVQTLLATPEAEGILRRLPQSQRNSAQLQKDLTNYWSAANRQTNEYWSTTINGMSNNDVEQFMNLNLTDPKYHLSKADIEKFQDKQAKIAKNPSDDPRVSRAQGWMRAAFGTQLESLGIYRRTASDPGDYDHYTGALQEALNEWQQDHGKPPSYKEVVEQIGPQIIQTQADKQGFWAGIFGGQEPAFKQFTRPVEAEVPPEFRQQVTQDVVKAGGAVPTDRQVYEAYVRQQFIKLYGGAAKKSETPQ